MVLAPQGACRRGTTDGTPRGRREEPGGGEARAPVAAAGVRGRNWVAGLWFLPPWSTKSGALRIMEASAPRRQPVNSKFV